MGYPDIFRYKNPRLESIIAGDVIQQETADLVRTYLADFQTVEAKILSRGLAVAGLKRADEVEFYNGTAYRELRSWGKMYVARISIALGIPVYSDVFDTRGYSGDSYSAGSLGSSYHGNLIPLG